VTQSFNTTSSMGRLTLNVLLSWEVIGERVRDKIAASKRKGIWVGGPVPLGYRCIDKKLVVFPRRPRPCGPSSGAISTSARRGP
jgi:site-specific DNA recombinase